MPDAQGNETQEELMERVKKMSPEELQEFQKSRCIFCHIVAGKVQSKKIYEDDKIIAILDINPANPGHLLLMPKEHYSIMPQVPDKVLGHLFVVTKKLSHIALQALGVKGTNIIIQNGVAAGQKAQHFMVHLIPRKEDDGLPFVLEKKTISDNDYNTIKERLQKKINEIFGVQPSNEQEAEIVEEKVEKVENLEEANKIVEETNKEIEELKEAVEPEEEKEEEVEEEKEEEDMKFITSSTAKRYHVPNCAFAQNITKERRILITEEEAEIKGKKPCTCVSGRRMPLKNKTLDEKYENNEEVEEKSAEEVEEKIKEVAEEKGKEKPIEEKDKQDRSDLDDIARILGVK